MSTSTRIKMYDLISRAKAGKLADVVERDAELARLVRILMRPTHHHAAVVADPGMGKTSLIDALAYRLQRGHYTPLVPKIYRLDTGAILELMVSGDSLRQCMQALRAATDSLEGGIIAVEDIQLMAADDSNRLELTLQVLQTLSTNPNVRVIITTTGAAYHRLLRDNYVFARMFEAIELPQASPEQIGHMIEEKLPALERHHHLRITPEAVAAAIQYGARFGHGRGLPDAAIRLLEDTAMNLSLAGRPSAGDADVKAMVAERERMPLGDLETSQDDKLVTLGPMLDAAVVGQSKATRAISAQIARSQLGLGDPSKPRGSFLLLGPSGVGKTETAKALTSAVYANPSALIRLDMSEYAEAHAAVRLIGSPPGYVGYEEGGQLTGAVGREPYSLVLLDEIEKAHPKLFDLFLQLLDDGRLTDSSGRTVDFTQTMVLATSNCGAQEIAAAAASGIDVNGPEFMQTTLLPLLLTSFRPEFINRFDAILVYRPLTPEHLVALAQRELGKLAGRLDRLGVSFNVADATLLDMLMPSYNPLFGARPVKRLVANQFETPIATRIIARQLQGPVTITGTEPWLREEQTV